MPETVSYEELLKEKHWLFNGIAKSKRRIIMSLIEIISTKISCYGLVWQKGENSVVLMRILYICLWRQIIYKILAAKTAGLFIGDPKSYLSNGILYELLFDQCF